MTADSFSPADIASMPRAEFAFPGSLRDQLVAAILDGSKTSTTGLVIDHEHEGDPLPQAGDRSVVVGSDGRPVAVIEVTGVRVVPLGQVDLAHAVDEGEGHTGVAEWREAHERFWHGEDMRAALEDPGFTVDDTTPVVLERFRLLTDLRPRIHRRAD
ncbi:ASCH domain-containing protein [Streptomyces hawaiiensis]|uniref:ASCH domain-containing protein n=1 Tax=Streptomyces hawaiiensis TaxID=67305 RepID=UPI00365F3359